MALYRYTALEKNGRSTIGMINADSLELAKKLLRKENILVIKLSSYTKKWRHLTISSELLMTFTRDLYTLLQAGLPLYSCLSTLEEKYRRSKLHPVFLNLCDQIKKGQNLSEALKSYPKIFNEVYLAMIKAGEESGLLDKSFMHLEQLIGQETTLKKNLVSAMIYPAFVTAFCSLLIFILLFFLIPSMSELFEDRTLHPMTQSILFLSHFLRAHAMAIFSSLFIFLSTLVLIFRHPKGKVKMKKLLLHIPVIKRIITEMILSRFFRVFSALFKEGITMISCMKLSKKVMKHPTFEAVISKVEAKVLEGGKMSEAFQTSPFIPILVVRMLAIAEESGRVAEIMSHLSGIYEQDVKRSLTRLTSLLQPIILLFLGVVVAIVVLSVLLPLTDVSSMLN